MFARGQIVKVLGEGILKDTVGTFYSDYGKTYIIHILEPEHLKGEELYIPKSKYTLEIITDDNIEQWKKDVIYKILDKFDKTGGAYKR
jgi:hypothetical protein